MKLFKISPSSFPSLIKMETEDGEPVASIAIGERGRGRAQVIIPIIGDGPEVRPKKTPNGIVLVRGDWPPDTRCLAVIRTVGAYDRHRSYELFDAKGIEEIATGVIAFGDAGLVNGGEEILAIVNAGGEFRLNSKYSSTWYRWDGKDWETESPEERHARLALQEVEAGGGEWL